jgi:hypothetical protein
MVDQSAITIKGKAHAIACIRPKRASRIQRQRFEGD